MVFKRPNNNRDDRNNRSNGGDNKRSNSGRGSSAKNTDRSNSDNPKKRYTGGPSADRGSAFSAGPEKKGFGPRKPYSGRAAEGNETERPRKSYGAEGDKRSFGPRNKPYTGRPSSGGDEDRPKRASSFGEKKDFGARGKSFGTDRAKKNFGSEGSFNRKPKGADFGDKPKRGFGDKPFRKREDQSGFDAPLKTLRPKKATKKIAEDDGLIRLNRYIANAGICSRRKADELITAGVVSVNGVVVNELGLKVDPMKDEIRYNGETLKREKSVYVLLNKPKDYITTTDDPQERRTVMHLVEKASRERIYPIGRLDRNTTGLLLMTNDGDLADKLSHPRSNITKIYHVELNKNLTQGDLNKLQFGLELEDGPIKPDSVSYVTGATKREVGVQIHSGKNRIVRRMFEHLGYEVVKLDRVVYANLTKKDLPRGRWRFLDEKEIIQLKHLIK